MKNEIMQKLYSVINALNTIEVKGKTNLANLYGSIEIIEGICKMIANTSDKDKGAE